MNDSPQNSAVREDDETVTQLVPGTELVETEIEIERPLTKMVEYDITFKTDSTGNKRPSFKMLLPNLTEDGLIAALKDKTQRQFLLDLANNEIYKQARIQIADDEDITQEKLDLSKLELSYLANMPKAERTGGGISKETWSQWAEDYLNVMPAVTNKPVENISNQVAIFMKKFQTAKTNKPALKYLREQLALWVTHSQKVDDFKECYEFLDQKAEMFIKADDASLLEKL
jgi:hypothetical protein